MSVVQAKPIVERIADELYQRLRLLTAGYSDQFIASDVIRPRRNDTGTPEHQQIVLTQSALSINSELMCPGNPAAIAYVVTFNIHCRVMPSERDTTFVEEMINTMAAEVVRVVCDESILDDALQWHTFGNLAIDAEWLPHENVDTDGSYDGVIVPLAVTFRVSEKNPFTVRA